MISREGVEIGSGISNNSISHELAMNFDLIRQSNDLWDLFTAKEEYNTIFTDHYGRFPYYLSTNRNILEPEVSKYLVENGLDIEYPEDRKFAICLTHDIDLLQVSRIATCIESKNLFGRPLHNINKRWNHLWNFRDIIALEERYEAKSTFFFLSLDKGDKDFNYKAENVRDEMRYIVNEGWEVGLHGGHTAYNDIDALTREKCSLEKALGKKVIGYRSHFLRFKVPDTWELLKDAGFCYDATFGHSYCVGFRNGMCHPFKPFNLNTNTGIDILEIPLVIMDATFDDTYMRLDADTAWRLTKRLIDTAEQYHGVLTILWHNNSMSKDKLKLYNNILSYGQARDAWMTSCKEIYSFWMQGENETEHYILI